MFWKKTKNKNVLRQRNELFDCMVKNRIKNDFDIDAETARNNYEAYQNDLRQRQQDFIKTWSNKIKEASSKGEKFIFTDKFITDDSKNNILWLLDSSDCVCDFPPNLSIQYFYEYFGEKGFKVVKIEYPTNNICCLKIIWIPSDNT